MTLVVDPVLQNTNSIISDSFQKMKQDKIDELTKLFE
jgi:hypothetical protein